MIGAATAESCCWYFGRERSKPPCAGFPRELREACSDQRPFLGDESLKLAG
jgi:hypothetical protein